MNNQDIQYVIDKAKLQEFIEHWRLITTPYDETNPEHVAIDTVIKELKRYIEVFSLPIPKITH